MKRFIFCYEVRKNIEVVVLNDSRDEAEKIADKTADNIARDTRLLDEATATVVEMVYSEVDELP